MLGDKRKTKKVINYRDQRAVGKVAIFLSQTLPLTRFPDYDTLVPVGFWMALRLADSETCWQNAAMEKTTDLLLPLGECGPRAFD